MAPERNKYESETTEMLSGASVILAAYNGQEYLKQQLDSIVGQSHLPSELIILDDNSSDATVSIIQEFVVTYEGPMRIRTLLRKENVGYVRNFLQGIMMAEGEYVFLSDQDDIWHENRVSYALEFFDRHPSCVVLHSDSDIINSEGKILRHSVQGYLRSAERLSLRKFVSRVNYPGMAMAFRRRAIHADLAQICTSQVSIPSHDWLLAYLGCKAGGLYVTNEVLTQRRKTERNVALRLEETRLGSIKRRIEGIQIYRNYYQLLADLGEQSISPSKYLACSMARIRYLERLSLIRAISNIGNLRYYPSFKSFLGDLFLIFKWNLK